METIEEPSEEFYRVTLFFQAKLARTRSVDLLQEFVRADLALEQARVPKFLRETSEPPQQF